MAKTNKQVTTQTIRNERAPGGDIPEAVMTYIAAHPELFQQYQSHDRDTERVMKLSKAGIAKQDAEAIAWLLWRSRLVQSWTVEAPSRKNSIASCAVSMPPMPLTDTSFGRPSAS